MIIICPEKEQKKSHAKLIDNKEMIKNNPVFIQEMIKNTCIISLKFHYNGISKQKGTVPPLTLSRVVGEFEKPNFPTTLLKACVSGGTAKAMQKQTHCKGFYFRKTKAKANTN